MEKKLTKHPEEFGHGAIEGVAGPEATNNASAAGGLVPLLTLGIPTTATAAVMLGAFQSYGIEPGPRLLDDQPELVWGLIASRCSSATPSCWRSTCRWRRSGRSC